MAEASFNGGPLKAAFHAALDGGRDGSPNWVLSLERAGSTCILPIYANEPSGVGRRSVRRLVVLIHGDRRRAVDYVDALLADRRSGDADAAAIIAPHFPVAGDLLAAEQQAGTLYWSTHGWKEGALSRVTPFARAWRSSSFEVVDALIAAAIGPDSWPNIAEVVVVGHSAGGQFAQRYAAGTTIDRDAGRNLELAFVVANPSSYLHFSPDRYDQVTRTFRSPAADALAQCPGADRYKYGLRGRNQYMSRATRRVIRARYLRRRVLYVAGALDVDPGDERLDTSCAANLQGASRYERALRYFQYLRHEFGEEAERRHRLVILPHVGHDVREVFSADPVRKAIFGEASLRSWDQLPAERLPDISPQGA